MAPQLVAPSQSAIRCEETGAPCLPKPWSGELYSVYLLSVLGPPPCLYSTGECGSGEAELPLGIIHYQAVQRPLPAKEGNCRRGGGVA